MKNDLILYISILLFFSFNCFAQSENPVVVNSEKRNTQIARNDLSKNEEYRIVSYHVVENIRGNITTYNVSNLSRIDKNDLGPYNSRVITPKYVKVKINPKNATESSKSNSSEEYKMETVTSYNIPTSTSPVADAIKKSKITAKKSDNLFNHTPTSIPPVTNSNIKPTITTKKSDNLSSPIPTSIPPVTNSNIKPTITAKKSDNLSSPILTSIPPITDSNIKPTITAKKSDIPSNHIPTSIPPITDSNIKSTITAKKIDFVIVDVFETYERILDKGEYESKELLESVANNYFFKREFIKAIKWYSQLFQLKCSIENEYYYRYGSSLLSLGRTKEGEELIALFKKNILAKQ